MFSKYSTLSIIQINVGVVISNQIEMCEKMLPTFRVKRKRQRIATYDVSHMANASSQASDDLSRADVGS